MIFIEKISKRQVVWLVISFCCILIACIISVAVPNVPLIVTILLIVLTQLSSCFFFPIVVGYYIEKEKAKEDFGIINSFYQDFSEGGIIRVYKDREASENVNDNGLVAMKKAFDEHDNGEIKLIGVSLRVFFSQTGPFYPSISKLCEKSKDNYSIHIKALINSETAPETINRGKIESPGLDPPTIINEMRTTKSHIRILNSNLMQPAIECKDYDQAPYCTAVIFPEKCFISQNLLCKTAPVKLPLIIFRKGSHGYEVINDYFDYLWSVK